MKVREDLAEVTRERDGLLVIFAATLEVVSPEQFAEIRRLVASRDRGASD